MDELIPSSPSLPSASQLQPASLQQRLQHLLENQIEWWTYAIFWQTTMDDEGCILLTWGDGFFQGTTVIKEIHGLVVENHSDIQSNIVTDDAEWFYVKSLAKSFCLSYGVPGKAFSTGSIVWLSGDNQLGFQNCERAKEAKIHGIQTMVFIPTSNGVVELGSNVIITENWSLVHQVKCSFESDLYDLGLVSQQNSILGTINPNDIDVLSDQIQEGAQQKMMKALPSPKISDSTCQKTPKKRGRKPRNIGRPEAQSINHVDAERHRREKLKKAFCELQSVVPCPSTMDRASLLSAAVLYIKELKEKVEELEFKRMKMEQLEIEVKIVGEDIRVQSENTNYPVTRLIDAIRDLELQLHHASMSSVNNLMIQDVVLRVPGDGLATSEDALKTALVTSLEK